ncbi:MAG TPA: hypothetical protein PKI68_04860 [Pontiellaceae bacterium]|nr:hypothetical protein [Pontiellaceae bacterium]
MKRILIIGIVGLSAVCAVSSGAEVPAAVHTPAALPAGKGAGSPEQTAVLNQVLGLLDQSRTDDAAALLEKVPQADAFSPMKEYLQARLAFERGQYTEALQHLAQVENFGGRDSEWLPASVFLEGMVYKKTGQTEAAAFTAQELVLGWPESVWSRRAAELK